MMGLERLRREGCVDASLVVFSTLSPLSRRSAVKIIGRGSVLILRVMRYTAGSIVASDWYGSP